MWLRTASSTRGFFGLPGHLVVRILHARQDVFPVAQGGLLMSGRSGKRKSSSGRAKSPHAKRRKVEPGRRARTEKIDLQSYEVGALPLINRLLERMRLEEILTEQLPADDPRTEL